MNVVEELENVLAEEQQILLTGDYASLQGLLDRKSKLAETLAAGGPELSQDVYEKLSGRAKHNEALLNSARRGIQAALSQLREISSGAHQSTYTRGGERTPMSRPVSVTQKY